MHPAHVTPWVLLASLVGCARGDSTRATWSTSSTVLAGSESRPAWTLRKLGSDGFDSVASVAALPDGGLVIAGHFEGTIELGSDRLVSAGETDAFIARLDAAGEIEWAERLGGAGFDAATAVLVDRAGNPIVVGDLSGTAVIGERRLRASGPSDVFAVSFAEGGAIRWVVRLGESYWDTAAAAALTSDGSIAVVGSSGRSDRHDDRTGAGRSDVLVALLDPTGALRWQRNVAGTGWDQGFAVAAHGDGSIAVAGSFDGTLELGTRRLVSAGMSDGFLLFLSPAGRVEEARRIGGKGRDAITALASWQDGQTALAGHFTGTVSFGATTLVGQRGSRAFVARLDRSGEPSFALDTGPGEAAALLALPDGALLLAGSYSLALELVASDPSEVVLHHIAASGQARALLRLTGSLVTARGLALTRRGDAAVVGAFAQRARLGPRAIESSDGLDGYLMTAWLAAAVE